MAVETKLPGYEWILFIAENPDTPTWVPVACLTSNEMDNTQSPIDTTSKCDDGESSSIPGPNSWTMSGSGFTIDDRGATKASFLKLYKYYAAKKLLGVRWARKNMTAADYYYEGLAYITSLKQTADMNDSVKFDVELTGQKKLTIGGSY